MKRDKKYLLIIDDYDKILWYKELSINHIMNAKIILQTYYKYHGVSLHNKIIISNKINNFNGYRSTLLEDGYIEDRTANVLHLLDL